MEHIGIFIDPVYGILELFIDTKNFDNAEEVQAGE